MKYLLIGLLSLFSFKSIAQQYANDISADIFFISIQHGDNIKSDRKENGILISLYNNSEKDYYIDNGMNIGNSLFLLKNNLRKSINDIDPKNEYNGTAEQKVMGRFDEVMASGNGPNNIFSKPPGMLEYTNNLIISKNNKLDSNIKGIALRTSLYMIFLKSKSTFTLFFNLSEFKIAGKQRMLLDFNAIKIPLSSLDLAMPQKIKEYNKYTEKIESNVLEVLFP